jgi:tetratricopeptide (TPR) repeat protein
MRTRLLANAVAVVVALALPANADTPMQEARVLVDAADRDYKLARFEQALAEYTKAYEKFPAAALLFNIAQCHRNLGQLDKAVFFYEGFLRDARKDDPNRGVVEDLLREARDGLAKQQAARADDEAKQRLEAEHTEAEAQARAAQEAEARRRAEEDARRRVEEDRRLALARRPDEPPVYRKWWFWSAVGGAAIAAGVTGYVLTRSTTIVEPSGSLGGLDRR